MQTSEHINEIIRRCKYNNDNIQRDIYPRYLSTNLNFIDQDMLCSQLESLSGINTKSPYLVETLDNNGIGMVNNIMFDIMMIVLILLIIFFIRIKLI